MCERLTSHLFKVKEREILVHTICSHSETRSALNLSDKDPNIIEVEWCDGNALPSIRFSNQDADEQQLVEDWYAKRFSNRMDMVRYCVNGIKGGSLDLRGCDLNGITLPTSVGGSLDLRGCDLNGITAMRKKHPEFRIIS